MKTKHLLYTLALTSVFAACSEDEFIANNGQNGVQANRPTLSNVTLTVDQESAQTRMAYEGAYVFEAGDTIAAILMDRTNEGRGYASNTDAWKSLSWLERYQLMDEAHTNYPFIYDGTTFKANANMLEGNYFLTYPYMTFEGERQPYYDITNQKQFGDDAAALKDSYAKNQFFIGYAKLDAGKGVADIKATLHPVLAPIRITIKGKTLGDTYTIKKIVLQGRNLVSQVTIDPTNAAYKNSDGQSWNLKQEGKTNYFNYANYLDTYGKLGSFQEELYDNDRYGSLQPSDYVYNISEGFVGAESDTDRDGKKYYYSDAIRQVVKPLTDQNNAEYFGGHADIEVFQKDGSPVTLKGTEEFKILMMVTPFDFRDGKDGDLKLSIYTDKGIVQNIDLTKVNDGQNDNYQTSSALVWATPEKFDNKVTVFIDDDAIVPVPTEVTFVNDTQDLASLVEWATQQSSTANIKAVFTDDITIDDALAAKIKQMPANSTLTIASAMNASGKGNRLKIATSEANKDVLEYIDVISLRNNYYNGVIVEVVEGGVVALTDKTYNMAHAISVNPEVGQLSVEVAKGGKLLIESNDQKAVQAGFDATGKRVANRPEVIIDNQGEIVVTATKALGFHITNSGLMTVEEGAQLYFAPLGDNNNINSKNTIRGTIEVKGTISGTLEKNFENYGVINNWGTVSNLLNKGNNENLRPGQVNIMNTTAVTTVNENGGIINYGANLEATVTLLNGYENEGVIRYTGAGVALTDLNEGNVTEANITSGTLEIDDVETTLNKLVVENATVASADPKAPAYLDLVGNIVLKGNTTVKDVTFYSLVKTTGEPVNYQVLVQGSTITFEKTVGFYGSASDAEYDAVQEADVHFNDADVVNKGTLTANHLYSAGDKSDIDNNAGTIKLLGGVNGYANTITIHGNQPQAINEHTAKPADPAEADGPYLLNTTGATLKAFAEALEETAYTEIEISVNVDFSLKDNYDYISKLEGKHLIVSGQWGSLSLGDKQITVKELTLKSTRNEVIKGTANMPAIITDKVTVDGVNSTQVVGRVQMTETAKLNQGSNNIKVSNITTGNTRYITGETSDGTILCWGYASQLWIDPSK